MRSRHFPAREGKRAASTSGAESSRALGSSVLAIAVGLVVSGCGGGPANVLDPPSFITGAHPAPDTATYEPVTGETEAGEYAFPWELYEDGPECHEPDPPATCPPVRIGIEDTPVAFTHPAFHGRVVLDGATFAYWRPLASQAAQRAFSACTEEAPCRVFYIDSGGDPVIREDRARTVLEHMGLPEGDSRWFLYDRAQGERGWYELPGFEDYSHGTQVALAALGISFHPFPFPDPVIVPMARNFDPGEQREDQHYFSDLVAEMRRDPELLGELDRRFSEMLSAQHDAADIINGSYGLSADINSVRGRDLLRIWREDYELLQERSPLTWAEYTQRDTPEADRTIRVWATGNDRERGVPPSVAVDDPYGEFPNVLTGDGYRSLNALGPFYFPELRGQHIAVTALGEDEERLAPYANACGDLPDDWDAARYGRHFCLASPTAISESLLGTSFAAPFVSGVLARMQARFPGVTPLELVRKLMHTADGYREDGSIDGGFDGDIHVVEIQGSSIEVDGEEFELDDVGVAGSASDIGGYIVVQRGCRRSSGSYLVATGDESDVCVVWGQRDGTEDAAVTAAAHRFLYLYGAGRVDVDAEDPDEAADRAGAFAPVSAPKLSARSGAPGAGGRDEPADARRLRIARREALRPHGGRIRRHGLPLPLPGQQLRARHGGARSGGAGVSHRRLRRRRLPPVAATGSRYGLFALGLGWVAVRTGVSRRCRRLLALLRRSLFLGVHPPPGASGWSRIGRIFVRRWVLVGRAASGSKMAARRDGPVADGRRLHTGCRPAAGDLANVGLRCSMPAPLFSPTGSSG